MGDTPAGITALELDALWEAFHHAVNMTSGELAAWLAALPAGVGDSERGGRVLHVLHKRRGDLTDDDIATMYDVVDTVAEPPPDRHPDPALRRAHLMTLGHDPSRT